MRALMSIAAHKSGGGGANGISTMSATSNADCGTGESTGDGAVDDYVVVFVDAHAHLLVELLASERQVYDHRWKRVLVWSKTRPSGRGALRVIVHHQDLPAAMGKCRSELHGNG